ncbi:thioredoxin family protein [Cronobacter universalis]|nr:thioredoxin family protein [Cronobacter universalis]
MKMLFRSLWLLALSVSAAWAADSGWLPPAQPSHAHIQLRSGAPADGKVRLLLAITLDKGWKTYWRTPGDGGFRPVIDWSSQAQTTWHWPQPALFADNPDNVSLSVPQLETDGDTLTAHFTALNDRGEPADARRIQAVSLVLSSGATSQQMTVKPDGAPLFWQAVAVALLGGHKRVLVNITADWCLNCKVNEVMVLRRPDVVKALQQSDVVLLQGNWSKPSAEIETFLRRHGAGGIPFNAVFGTTTPDGEVLSSLLNKTELLGALDNAGAAISQTMNKDRQ